MTPPRKNIVHSAAPPVASVFASMFQKTPPVKSVNRKLIGIMANKTIDSVSKLIIYCLF